MIDVDTYSLEVLAADPVGGEASLSPVVVAADIQPSMFAWSPTEYSVGGVVDATLVSDVFVPESGCQLTAAAVGITYSMSAPFLPSLVFDLSSTEVLIGDALFSRTSIPTMSMRWG